MCCMYKLPTIFTIFVDRIEGDYAVCELPDETMCDVSKDLFPEDLKERERYQVEIQTNGEFRVIKKFEKTNSTRQLPCKLIRF